jgi:hypothetical protein
MSLKNLLLPAAVLISVIAFLASHANAQTMGEYATTTAGVGTGTGSMSTGFSLPSFPGSSGSGASSQTWGVSGTGSSWSDRAGAASGSGLGADFESRAGSMSSGAAAQSRWPDSGLSKVQGLSFEKSKLDEGEDRFGGSDRFPSRDFSSANRWPTSSLSDSKSGLDTSYNSVSGN